MSAMTKDAEAESSSPDRPVPGGVPATERREHAVMAPAKDDIPEGVAFLDRVASREDKRLADFRDLLRSSSSYQELRSHLGTLLSLMDRVGSCWWGCSGDHTVVHIIAASSGNAFASFRLLQAGYYDESIGLSRQIGERANLLQLFLMDGNSLAEWKQYDDDRRRQRFKAYDVRTRLERLGNVPVVNMGHYRMLSGFGIHPGATPQYFGESFPPTPGGHFRMRGMMISLSELAYNVGMIGGTGAALLGDDGRIPSGRMIQAATALMEEQQKLHKVVEDWFE
jgi:hypothetical protein